MSDDTSAADVLHFPVDPWSRTVRILLGTVPKADPTGSDITRLLAAHAEGDEEALPRLFQAVYSELKRLAHHKRRMGPAGDTLDTTGLVHEVYLKLARSAGSAGRDRGHFFNLAAQAMRQILVDYARGRRAAKRGAGVAAVTLEPESAAVERQADLLVAVDAALERLAEGHPRRARVFECRYFAGLTAEETALAVDSSVRTAEREWSRAREWLRAELS